MLFKNVLLGLGGTAVVGGVGYGIYASSQANDEDKTTINKDLNGKNENVLSGDEDGDSSTEKDKEESNDTQGEGSETTGGSSGGPGA